MENKENEIGETKIIVIQLFEQVKDVYEEMRVENSYLNQWQTGIEKLNSIQKEKDKFEELTKKVGSSDSFLSKDTLDALKIELEETLVEFKKTKEDIRDDRSRME